MSEIRRSALADFLRSHRAKITPAEVGMAPGVRRRTPGLRREEVALLAGVGVTWYTWLEQGRDINPSPEVLAAIARTLRLTDAERDYLFRLAGAQPPVRGGGSEPPEHLVQFVYAQDPAPAMVLDERWDLRVWNFAAETLYGYSRWPEADRNGAYLMFAAPEIQDRLVDWTAHARRMVGELRETFAGNPEDHRLGALIDRLREEFPAARAFFDERTVSARVGGVAKELKHPVVGSLLLNQLVLRPADAAGLHLIVLLPQPGTDTALRLADLVTQRATAPATSS